MIQRVRQLLLLIVVCSLLGLGVLAFLRYRAVKRLRQFDPAARGARPATSAADLWNQGIEKVKAIMKDCNFPLKLSDVGVTEGSIPIMAKDAMKIQRLLKNNPRVITEEDAIEIYKAAF